MVSAPVRLICVFSRDDIEENVIFFFFLISSLSYGIASELVAWIDMILVSINPLIAYYGEALALIAFYHPISCCGLHTVGI